MRANKLMYFVLSIIFMMGFSCQSMAQVGSGPLWLGTKSLPAKFLIEVAKGNIPGHSVVHKFGKGIVGTTMVPIASSLAYQTPTTATALEVVSSSANDTAAGSGAREITIIGLDSTWTEITQVVPTNGLTAVPIPISMLRIYRWWVSASGTYATSATGSHAGIITIQELGAGALWFNATLVPYPKSQSEIACFTVPDGYRAFIFIQAISVDSTKSVDVVFITRQDADIIVAPFTAMRVTNNFVGVSGSNASSDQNVPWGPFPARTDLLFMGVVAASTASISVDFEILLIEDGY